jgi:hypothetical protein
MGLFLSFSLKKTLSLNRTSLFPCGQSTPQIPHGSILWKVSTNAGPVTHQTFIDRR